MAVRQLNFLKGRRGIVKCRTCLDDIDVGTALATPLQNLTHRRLRGSELRRGVAIGRPEHARDFADDFLHANPHCRTNASDAAAMVDLCSGTKTQSKTEDHPAAPPGNDPANRHAKLYIGMTQRQ